MWDGSRAGGHPAWAQLCHRQVTAGRCAVWWLLNPFPQCCVPIWGHVPFPAVPSLSVAMSGITSPGFHTKSADGWALTAPASRLWIRTAELQLLQKKSSLCMKHTSDVGRGCSGLQSTCWEMLGACVGPDEHTKAHREGDCLLSMNHDHIKTIPQPGARSGQWDLGVLRFVVLGGCFLSLLQICFWFN